MVSWINRTLDNDYSNLYAPQRLLLETDFSLSRRSRFRIVTLNSGATRRARLPTIIGYQCRPIETLDNSLKSGYPCYSQAIQSSSQHIALSQSGGVGHGGTSSQSYINGALDGSLTFPGSFPLGGKNHKGQIETVNPGTSILTFPEN